MVPFIPLLYYQWGWSSLTDKILSQSPSLSRCKYGIQFFKYRVNRNYVDNSFKIWINRALHTTLNILINKWQTRGELCWTVLHCSQCTEYIVECSLIKHRSNHNKLNKIIRIICLLYVYHGVLVDAEKAY